MNSNQLFILTFVIVGATLTLLAGHEQAPTKREKPSLQAECRQIASPLQGDAATRVYQHCLTIGTI